MTNSEIDIGLEELRSHIKRLGTMPMQILMRADAFTNILIQKNHWSHKDSEFLLTLILSNGILVIDDRRFLILTEEGYTFFNEEEKRKLCINLQAFISTDTSTYKKDKIFYLLWDIIGTDKENNPFYVDGPTFFYAAKKYISALPSSYSQYDKDLKEQTGKSIARSTWGKNLFLSIPDNELPSFFADLSQKINEKLYQVQEPDKTEEDVLLEEIEKSIIEDQRNNKSSEMQTTADPPRVFIVHGHDEATRLKVELMVKQLGLEPIVLFKQPNMGATIIEKLEREMGQASFAIVLYTKCDQGKSISDDDLRPRARQNVVFEHGMICGMLGRQKVVALVEAGIEIPGDLSGVVYIGIDEKEAWKYALAKEMKGAGINIDMNAL